MELIKGFAKYWGSGTSLREDGLGHGGGGPGRPEGRRPVDGHATLGEAVPVRGDLVANGFTILPWRSELLDFSEPTFPSQIWLIAQAGSTVKPIHPSREIQSDIGQVRRALAGKTVLAMSKLAWTPACTR